MMYFLLSISLNSIFVSIITAFSFQLFSFRCVTSSLIQSITNPLLCWWYFSYRSEVVKTLLLINNRISIVRIWKSLEFRARETSTLDLFAPFPCSFAFSKRMFVSCITLLSSIIVSWTVAAQCILPYVASRHVKVKRHRQIPIGS